jgi:putative oxidoreductase
MMDDRGRNRWSDWALTVLRIVVGFLFFCHGAQKMLGWFADPGMPPHPTPAFPSMVWVAGILELVGGAFIALGILTRPVAFLLSGEMAVAYFKAHAPHGWVPLLNHGELAALYSFIFLFFAAHGGGPHSLERSWRRGRRT